MEKVYFPLEWGKFFLSSTWHDSNTLDLHTDASGALGYGGIYRNKWFQGKWKSHQLLDQPGVSIAWQELYAIVVACEIFSMTSELGLTVIMSLLRWHTSANVNNYYTSENFIKPAAIH